MYLLIWSDSSEAVKKIVLNKDIIFKWKIICRISINLCNIAQQCESHCSCVILHIVTQRYQKFKKLYFCHPSHFILAKEIETYVFVKWNWSREDSSIDFPIMLDSIFIDFEDDIFKMQPRNDPSIFILFSSIFYENY